MTDLSDLRHDFQHNENNPLSLNNTPDTPWPLLHDWLTEAQSAKYFQPNAMSLATVSPEGKPSCRIVLLKSFTPEAGIIFYTHYLSKKGQDLAHNPHAALLLYWDQLEKQIRIEGSVSKISAQDSDHYFHTRPYLSQLGAAISPQSQIIPDRSFLDQAFQNLKHQYPESSDNLIPRPEHWGGYVLKPTYFEFWQGRASRLHDRVVYSHQAPNSHWEKYLLAP